MAKDKVKEQASAAEDAATAMAESAAQEVVEKRDIRANLLAARKKQLLRKKRGYGRLPSSLRR